MKCDTCKYMYSDSGVIYPEVWCGKGHWDCVDVYILDEEVDLWKDCKDFHENANDTDKEETKKA